VTVAVLPVKDPAGAKQRLAGVMDLPAREALARAMYEHVLEVLRQARRVQRILVVTSHPATAERARQAGALVMPERLQLGHSSSAGRAALRAQTLGATTALLLPIDIPLVTPAEIDDLVAGARPGVRIVPDTAGTGTNALVLTPPGAIEPCFGPGSFARHLGQARRRGLAVEVRRPPGVVFDVDTPEDARELLARRPDWRGRLGR